MLDEEGRHPKGFRIIDTNTGHAVQFTLIVPEAE